jgi:hypothetical protein
VSGDLRRVSGIDDDPRLSRDNPANHRRAIQAIGVERA